MLKYLEKLILKTIIILMSMIVSWTGILGYTAVYLNYGNIGPFEWLGNLGILTLWLFTLMVIIFTLFDWLETLDY